MRVPFRAGRAKFLQLALWFVCVAGLQHQLPRHPRDSPLQSEPVLMLRATLPQASSDPLALQQAPLEPDDRPTP